MFLRHVFDDGFGAEVVDYQETAFKKTVDFVGVAPKSVDVFLKTLDEPKCGCIEDVNFFVEQGVKKDLCGAGFSCARCPAKDEVFAFYGGEFGGIFGKGAVDFFKTRGGGGEISRGVETCEGFFDGLYGVSFVKFRPREALVFCKCPEKFGVAFCEFGNAGVPDTRIS